jgi:O-antigen/teichoic acid export membrane protein
MLWTIGAEIEYLAWAVVFGNFAALLYGALRVHRTHKFTLRFDVSALRMLVSFGAKLYVGSVIGFAGLYITGGIIATFLTQESVAFFQIALTRALLLTKLASALGTLLYPKIAAFNDDDEAGAITLFATVFRVNVLVTGSAALAMIVIATPTIKLLYGHSYTPVIVPFMILIAGVAIDSMTTNVLSLFSARGRPLIPTVLAAIVVIPQIVILLLIVPNGGVIIAAWITAGAFLLGTIFRLIAVKRVFAINLRDVLVPGKSDITLIISNLLRIIRRSR